MACPVVTGSLAAAISVSRHKFTNVQLKNYLKGLGSPKDNARYGSSSSGGTYLNLPTLINYMLTLTAIVTAPPGTLAISAQPMNRQAVVGEKIELSVSVVAPAGTTPTYQWYRNDMQLTTATSAKLTIASLAQIDGGKYRVQIRAGGATVTSQDAELKVALRYCN